MPYLQPSSATATFTVIVPTSISVNVPASVTAGQTFQALVTLTAGPGGISGATVFVSPQWGTAVNAVTSTGGLASITLTAPTTAGTYVINAGFNGTATYGASAGQVTIAVTALVVNVATALTLVVNASVAPGAPMLATGKLTRNDTATGVPSAPVTLSIDGGPSLSGTTDVNGNYSFSFTAPTAAGTHTAVVNFGGLTVATGILSPASISQPFTAGLGALDPMSVGIATLGIGIAALVVFSRKKRR